MKILKNQISMMILFLLILPKFMSVELLFVAAFAYCIYKVILFKNVIPKKLLGVLVPLILIVLLGGISSLTYSKNTVDIIRDIVYFTFPIILILDSYFLVRKVNNTTVVLNTIVIAGIILSLIHISNFIIQPTLITKSLHEVRAVAGNGNALTVVAMIILFFNKRYNLNIFENKKINKFLFFICAISLFLSLSRTLILIFVILFVFAIGKINMKRIKVTNLRIATLIFSIIIFVPILAMFFKSDYSSELVNKFKNSFKEIAVTDVWDWKSINNNWRGYEAYKAKSKFEKSPIINKLIGNGLGAKVELDITIGLAGSQYTAVTIIHNGYMYIIVKVGIVGLLLYIIFILNIILRIKKNKVYDSKLLFYNRLTVGSAIVILVTTYFITGIYSIKGFYMWLFIIGGSYAIRVGAKSNKNLIRN